MTSAPNQSDGPSREPPYLCGILGMVIRHWLPFALFGFLLLVFAGVIGHSFGLPHLFRDDPQLLEHGWRALRNSPALWGSAAATLLLITILIGVYVNRRLHKEHLGTSWAELSWYVVSRGLPFELLLLLAVAWRSYRTDGLAQPMTLAVGEAALGVLIGIALALLSATLMNLLYVRMYAWLADTGLGRASTGFLQWATVQSLSNNQSPHAAWIALYFFAGVLLVTLPFMIYEIIVPAVALCILLVWVILGYFFLGSLRPLVRHPAILAVLLIYGVFSYDAFRNRLPGFMAAGQDIDLYDCPLQLHNREHSCAALRDAAPAGAAATEADPAALETLAGSTRGLSTASEGAERTSTLDDRTRVLVDAWRSGPAGGALLEDKRAGAGLSRGIIAPLDPRKHKLVVVTTSGGAYRAAFWTAMVLDELVSSSSPGRALAGFADQIRLLTGASGGMVASAYFTALASPAGWSGPDPPSIHQHLVDDIRNARDSNKEDSAGRFKTGFPIDRDSLGPVAQQALQRDAVRSILIPFSGLLPDSWTHWRAWGDRGLALEEQWATLNVSFRDIEQGVAEGWRPWLILSPMIADTGQPILISNVPTEPVLERVDGAALDLFDLFPGQQDQLKVSTAVRMNASFPYISPAVSLPTVPKRRIVDAGYYDNYGVNTALAWMSQDGMLEYLRNNVSGIVVIQIRAYATTSSVPEPDGDERPDFPLLPEWLTSPLTGVMSARSASMLYRNNEQLKLFIAQFCDGFVQTVALENRAKDKDIGMSWYLRPEELLVMQTELDAAHNQHELNELARIWRSDQRCPPASGREPTAFRPSAPASVVPASATDR